jgi:tetratricopeptide (TPR) repeat protein
MSSTEIGAKAAKQAGTKNETNFSTRLNDFFRKYRTPILAAAALILVAVVATGVVSIVANDRLNKSTVALEALEASYDAWNKADEAKKPELSASLLSEIESIWAKYPRRYAALKAGTIKAELLYANKDLAGAEKAYASVAEASPKSHMAPVALANAASVAEDSGNKDAALAYLIRAEKDYPKAPGIARVTLSIGRIYEETKQYDKAMETYLRLISAGTESDWTKIAHDRIILLKSLGLVK